MGISPTPVEISMCQRGHDEEMLSVMSTESKRHTFAELLRPKAACQPVLSLIAGQTRIIVAMVTERTDCPDPSDPCRLVSIWSRTEPYMPKTSF